MPAMFSGITALKPTSGRLPQSGQGADGGFPGCVGIFNSLGFMSRSAGAIEATMELLLARQTLFNWAPVDARFVPLPWDCERARLKKKLKIGW